MLTVTFYGVRGSTPCPSPSNQRYGGNTSCVAIESPGLDPIVCDLGTGLRMWGNTLPFDGSFHGHALVTHLHWDHVQGLPFFVPILIPGASLTIHGPPQEDESLEDSFRVFMSPPYFPVGIDELEGEITFHDTPLTGTFEVGAATVTARPVPHVGITNGYRIEMGGASVAYISDHQMPIDGTSIAETVLELADGVDLLIHDSQYTAAEFRGKETWGHCTVDYAVHIAAEAGAKRLALFHHDPSHHDGFVDGLLAHATDLAAGRVDEIIAAAEGMTIAMGD